MAEFLNDVGIPLAKKYLDQEELGIYTELKRNSKPPFPDVAQLVQLLVDRLHRKNKATSVDGQSAPLLPL